MPAQTLITLHVGRLNVIIWWLWQRYFRILSFQQNRLLELLPVNHPNRQTKNVNGLIVQGEVARNNLNSCGFNVVQDATEGVELEDQSLRRDLVVVVVLADEPPASVELICKLIEPTQLLRSPVQILHVLLAFRSLDELKLALIRSSAWKESDHIYPLHPAVLLHFSVASIILI